jgi:hypothetical protein
MSQTTASDDAGESIDGLVADLSAALERDFGGTSFSNPDGWKFELVTAKRVKTMSACAKFDRDGVTLNVVVRPTDPENEHAYYRTARYDMSYFFENVPEEERSGLWQAHRSMLDGFAAWLDGWDKTTSAASESK